MIRVKVVSLTSNTNVNANSYSDYTLTDDAIPKGYQCFATKEIITDHGAFIPQVRYIGMSNFSSSYNTVTLQLRLFNSQSTANYPGKISVTLVFTKKYGGLG